MVVIRFLINFITSQNLKKKVFYYMLFGFILMKQLKQFTCNFSALAIEDRGCKTTNSSFFAMTPRIIHENIVQAILL